MTTATLTSRRRNATRPLPVSAPAWCSAERDRTAQGMHRLDDSLWHLAGAGTIAGEEAWHHADEKTRFTRFLPQQDAAAG